MMNLNTPVYLPDANVLMTAHHHYYAPAICPGCGKAGATGSQH